MPIDPNRLLSHDAPPDFVLYHDFNKINKKRLTLTFESASLPIFILDKINL